MSIILLISKLLHFLLFKYHYFKAFMYMYVVNRHFIYVRVYVCIYRMYVFICMHGFKDVCVYIFFV